MSVAGTPTVAAERRESVTDRVTRRSADPPVAFAELVWAHHLRQEALASGRQYEGPDEQRYRLFEERFRRQHGEIVSAYWSTATASGAAVTVKSRWFLPAVIRLHWATDWATVAQPKLDDVLYACEARAVKVGEVLRDTSQRVAMQWLFTIAAHVLGFAESAGAKDAHEIDEFVETQRDELADVRTYYYKAAQRCGQITYLAGALLGIMPPILLLLIVWLLGYADHTTATTRTGFACFAAGAVGALVSVMSRMTAGRVMVDWEFGKNTLRTMGSLRPFVGAIFGLLVFFALKSHLVDLTLINDKNRNFSFFILFSFAAGFSERFAQDMLLGATAQRFSREPEPSTARAERGDAPGAPPPGRRGR